MNSDPTPGDPDLIQGVVQRYKDIGDAAEKALNVIKKDGSLSQARGSSMDALKGKIGDDLPDKLTKTMNSYHDAAQAYTDYIPRLEEAQSTFDQAVDQASAASSKVADAATKTIGGALAPDATDQQKADRQAAENQADEGKSELSSAKSLAAQAKSMRETAQAACADVLDRAAGEAIPERNIFQKIHDFFADFPLVQILLGLLIAIVSVFFPVAGLLLGGALFALDQISSIASGDFSLGSFITGLIGIIPGAGLIGKLGGSAVKAVGAAEKIIPGVAKVAGGSIKGIGAAGKAGKLAGTAFKSTPGKVITGAATHFATGAGKEAASEAIDGKSLDTGAIVGAGIGGAIGGGGKALGKAGKLGASKGTQIAGGAATEGVAGIAGEASGEAIDGKPLDAGTILGAGATGAAGGAAAGAFGKFGPKKPTDSGVSPVDSSPIPTKISGPDGSTDRAIPFRGSLPSAQAVPVPPVTGLAPNQPLVIRTSNEPLFRDDGRSPTEIFQNGFQPRNTTNTDLPDFLEHNTHSGFVSTTTDAGLGFNTSGSHFHITAPGGIDANATLGDANPFPGEKEITFPGGIRPENVSGAQRFDGNGNLGPFEPNPNFNPGAPNPLAGRLPFGRPLPPPPLTLPPAGPLPPVPGGATPDTASSASTNFSQPSPPPSAASSAPTIFSQPSPPPSPTGSVGSTDGIFSPSPPPSPTGSTDSGFSSFSQFPAPPGAAGSNFSQFSPPPSPTGSVGSTDGVFSPSPPPSPTDSVATDFSQPSPPPSPTSSTDSEFSPLSQFPAPPGAAGSNSSQS